MMELKRRPDTAMSGPLETIRAAKLNGPELNPPTQNTSLAIKPASIAARRSAFVSSEDENVTAPTLAARLHFVTKRPANPLLMGRDTEEGIKASKFIENKKKNPLRNDEFTSASAQLRFEEYPPRQHKKDPCITFKLTDGKQVNTGYGRASRSLGFLMEVTPGEVGCSRRRPQKCDAALRGGQEGGAKPLPFKGEGDAA